jgi:4-amino-4-deoxy-L-arabinose transferase-like glycosyltransferase
VRRWLAKLATTPSAQPAARAPGTVGIAGVLVVYTVLALYAAFTVDLGRPADEQAHLEYIRFLLRERSLPVFTPDETNYEAHQPPLYYALGAATMAMSGGSPYAVRLLSVLLGMLVIWATYRLAAVLDPTGSPALPLGAAAFAAFLPMHVNVLSAVSNDPLAEAVFSLVCLGLVLGLKTGFTHKKAALLGVVLGLGMLAKGTCVLLVPVTLLALFLDWRRRDEPKKELLANAGIALAVMLGISGWLLARNTVLYGDPLVARRFEEVFKALGRPGPEYFDSRGFSRLIYWELVATWTCRSFWGIFGPRAQQMPAIVYRLAMAISLVAAVGAIRSAVRLWRRGDTEGWRKDALMVLALACLLVLAAFINFNTRFFQAQGRYLFPVISPIATAFVGGLASLVPPRVRAQVLLGFCGALLLLCVLAAALWM